jgi:hypothetical protein
MKTITIKWIDFEKKFYNVCHNWKTLYDLYKNPSEEKRDIYNYWNNKLDVIYWTIWNMHLFSIFWRITDEEWKVHDVKITKSKNFIIN